MKHTPQIKFLIEFRYLDDNGKKRRKAHVYAGNSINDASRKLHWQYRGVKELEILAWEIVKEDEQ